MLTRLSLLSVAVLFAPARWIAPLAAAVAAVQFRSVASELPEADLWTRVRITASRNAVTGRQVTDLALRHWWPLAVLAAGSSRRARRLLATVAVAEGVVSFARADTTLDPVRFTAARRLDDAAYGAGVWWGAARARSVRCLLPHLLRRQARP